VVPTISFRLLYGSLILRHSRRQILWLGVAAHPTAEWIVRQLTEAFGCERLRAFVRRSRKKNTPMNEADAAVAARGNIRADQA
jgi:hypothetical protein